MREVKLNNHHTFWIYVQEFRELKCVEPDLVININKNKGAY